MKVKAFKGKDLSNTVAGQDVSITVTNPDGSKTTLKGKTDKKGVATITVPNKGHNQGAAIGKDIKVDVTVPGTDEVRSTKVRILYRVSQSNVTPRSENEGQLASAGNGDAIYTPAFTYTSRIAVQIPEECVATTYYFTEVTEEAANGCFDYETPDELGYSSTPITVTTDDPNYVETPSDGVPICTRTPPPTLTVTPPPEDDKPPVTTVTETPTPEKEEPPDIGLAKATETVVMLVLTGLETGKPVEGATVKSLDAPPALELTGSADPALTSTEAFAGSVQAGFTGKDGNVTIGQDDASAQSDAQAKAQLASMTLVEVKVEEEKKGQLAIAMKEVETAPDAPKAKPVLPASLAQPGLDLCVDHSFSIGNTPVFIARLPKSQIDEFKRTATQTEGIYFVEDIPCRTIYAKEGPDAPDYADRVE